MEGTSKKSKRGFASMNPNKRRELASRGGQKAHEKGTAYTFDSETARRAGQIGGAKTAKNRQHMSAIGRRGGEANAKRLRDE
jgi:general stress protein YciG